MKEIRDFLDKCRAPDPGPEYWESMRSRVRSGIETPAEGRRMPRRAMFGVAVLSAAAACAVIVAILAPSIFQPVQRAPEDLPGRASPEPAHAATPAVEGSTKTAGIAAGTVPGGTLTVLGAAAGESAAKALEAMSRGDWPAVKPYLRSYERIIETALTRGVEKAVERGENVPKQAAGVREAVGRIAAEWRRLAPGLADHDSQSALESAIGATERLIVELDGRFAGKEQG